MKNLVKASQSPKLLKLLALVITFSIVAQSLESQAKTVDKVVYGDDNRVDVVDYPDTKFQEFALATAARVPLEGLSKNDKGGYDLTSKSMSADANVCIKERFASQPDVGECTGFLVAPDILVTAGHCVKSHISCANNYWVFDYMVGQIEEGSISEKNVYRCKKVLAQDVSYEDKKDYAIIQLDRSVTDRDPLKFRTEGKIEDNAQILVIGNPSGLPTKIADGAMVKKNENAVYFTSDLDTFGGNSGSPVFNKETGLVEGILVRGAVDYVTDPELKCRVVNLCKEITDSPTCNGEESTRITILNLNYYLSGEYLKDPNYKQPFSETANSSTYYYPPNSVFSSDDPMALIDAILFGTYGLHPNPGTTSDNGATGTADPATNPSDDGATTTTTNGPEVDSTTTVQ